MMTRLEIITVQTVKEVMSIGGLYQLAYSWLLGMSIWNSFFAGTIAYKTLPRHQFGALQHRIFPAYFLTSILLSCLLAVLWVYGHPDVLGNLSSPKLADVCQLYVLLSVSLLQGSNHFIIGPMTSRTMFMRHKLEKEEGKNHHDVEASAQMKALNRKFALLHGMSSLGNLCAIIAQLIHGLWIGTRGLRLY